MTIQVAPKIRMSIEREGRPHPGRRATSAPTPFPESKLVPERSHVCRTFDPRREDKRETELPLPS